MVNYVMVFYIIWLKDYFTRVKIRLTHIKNSLYGPICILDIDLVDNPAINHKSLTFSIITTVANMAGSQKESDFFK